MTDQQELRPCPFCQNGGEPKLVYTQDESFIPFCGSCGATVGHTSFPEQEAAAAWNTRATDELIERLEARVKELEEFVNSVKVYADCYQLNAKLDCSKDFAATAITKMGYLAKDLTKKEGE